MPRRTIALVLAAAALLPAAARAAGPPPAKQDADKLLAVLKSADASRQDKHRACQLLASVADAAAVPVLARLLADDELHHMARYALEPIPSPAVDKALREAMGKLTGEKLIGVIASIGVRRDAEAVGPLAKLLSCEDPAVAVAAATTLGGLADPKALAALADARRSAKGEALRRAVADGSLRAAARLLDAGQAEAAAAIYTDLHGDRWPRHVRLAAFDGLLRAEPGGAARRIADALDSDDAIVGATAIARIRELEGEGVGRRFAAVLAGQPPATQVLLIEALSVRQDPAVRKAVIAAAGSEHEPVRLAAVRALGRIGTAEGAAVLAKALASRSRAEREAAADALRALRGQGADEAILQAMLSADGAVRAELIDVLADRRSEGILDELLAEARAEDPAVAVAAMKALGRLAEGDDAPALIAALLETRSSRARSAGERALVTVCRGIPDADARADAVLAAYAKAEDPADRASLLRVAGGIGGAEAFAAAEAALEEAEGELREAAFRTLADWPDAAAVEPVLKVFLTTDNRTWGVLALRGLVRMLSLGEVPPERALAIYGKLDEKVARPEDRRLVLSGLARVPHPDALAAVEPYLDDPKLAREARTAAVSIAGAIVGSHPDAARAAARRVLKEAKNRGLKRQAQRILKQVRPAQPKK